MCYYLVEFDCHPDAWIWRHFTLAQAAEYERCLAAYGVEATVTPFCLV